MQLKAKITFLNKVISMKNFKIVAAVFCVYFDGGSESVRNRTKIQKSIV